MSWQVRHPRRGWRYYLAGSVLSYSLDKEEARKHYPPGSVLPHFPDMEAAARAADFLITRDRVESGALLTPRNEQVFLYDSAGIDDLVEFYRATYQRVVYGDPAARSHFDVYLHDGALFHLKDPCVRDDVGYEVFVEVVPEDSKDLLRWFRRHRIKKHFQYSGLLFEGKCMAILSLPDYPIFGIKTGQRPRRREGDSGWKVEIPASR